MNEAWIVTYWTDAEMRLPAREHVFSAKADALRFALLLHPKFRIHLDCKRV